MKFNIFQDQAGEWRWHLAATNGQIIADSGEGYVHKQHCIDMVRRIRADAHLAEISVHGEPVDTQS